MEIKLHYTDDEARKVFEAQGFSVEEDTLVNRIPIHGSNEQHYESSQLIVVNPDTGERILLENAMQRLVKRKMTMDLYWIDKMEVLDALNCKAADSSFKELLNNQ